MSEPKRQKTFDKTEECRKSQLEPKNQPTTKTDGGGMANNSRGEMEVEILPPELWEQIFKKVESPKDLLNCWNTSSVWKKVLRSTDFYFKLTLPFVLPYLSRRDWLRCCCVSKSWNVTVDACIQTAEDGDRYTGLRLSSRNLPEFINRFQLPPHSHNDPDRKIVAAIPAAFRSVKVYLWFHPRSENDPAVEPEERTRDPLTFDRNNLLTFLSHFGHLIYYLQLTVYGDLVTYLDKLELTHSCLVRTRNLRVFEISTANPGLNVAEENASDEEMEVVNAFISRNPWPELEHLKTLKFGNITYRLEFSSIAKVYAPQLVSLHLGVKSVESLRPQNKFPCLQKLDYSYYGECGGADFGAFLRSSECPLEYLKVTFVEDPDDKNCFDLTQAINAVSDTLTTLVLSSQHSIYQKFKSDITKFDRLRLPKLKQLSLSKYGYPSLEFLRSVCPVLQQLTLTPHQFRDRESKKAQEPVAMYCRLYSKHEFWNVLGDIERVEVECLVYFEEDEGKGGQKKRIPGGERRKLRYTRRGYEAKVAKDRDMGVNTQNLWNQFKFMSSSSEED